jgi:hypothetical protein
MEGSIPNKGPRRCEICDKVVFTPWSGVVVSHADTKDVGIVCGTCWEHYVLASTTCGKVLGCEFAMGARK